MARTMFGASVAVEIDFGITPIILGRDILDATAILHGGGSELADVTGIVLNIDCVWGAREPRGILTDVEAGRATITILDPDRNYDPGNEDRPTVLTAGANGRIKVDGNFAFAGYLDGIEHSLASGVTTVVLADAIPRLSTMAVSTRLDADETVGQMLALVAVMPFAPEADPTTPLATYGDGVTWRGEDEIADNAWAALNRLRDAELGHLWIDRIGRIAFAGRDFTEWPDGAVGIGDSPFVPLLDIFSALKRLAVVNNVTVSFDDPTPDRIYSEPGSVGRYGRRSLSADSNDLRLVGPLV